MKDVIPYIYSFSKDFFFFPPKRIIQAQSWVIRVKGHAQEHYEGSLEEQGFELNGSGTSTPRLGASYLKNIYFKKCKAFTLQVSVN